VSAGDRPLKGAVTTADEHEMSTHSRLSADVTLTLDEAVDMARADRRDVLRAIENRSLRAVQREGQWMVAVGDLRTWMSRR
jgi:hypothetical protein